MVPERDSLYRYPAVDPPSFRKRLNEALRSSLDSE
jgi:hypothetical protein